METHAERELDLYDLLSVLRRRRLILVGALLLFIIPAAIYCIGAPRRYRATGSVSIRNDDAVGLGLDSVMVESGAEATPGSLTINIVLQSQASILQSDTVALQVIKDLKLEQTSDFKQSWDALDSLDHLFGIRSSEPPGADLTTSPTRRAHALKVFSDNLAVTPLEGTRLISVSYINPDPRLAVAVVDAMIRGLQYSNYESRYSAANDAALWLKSQLGDMREDTESRKQHVMDLQQKMGVYTFAGTSLKGGQKEFSTVVSNLQASTMAVDIASSERILRGAIAKYADEGDPELLSGIAGNGVSSAEVSTSLDAIRILREQESVREAALQEARARYGSFYPELTDLQASVDATKQALNDEVRRVRGRADSDFAIATQTEKNLRAQFEVNKKTADDINKEGTEYLIAVQEAEDSGKVYEGILKRLAAAGVLAGIKSNAVSVAEPARVSPLPLEPRVPLYMGMALGCGIMLGCFGALFVDGWNKRISTVLDAEDILETSLLGVTPLFQLPPASIATPVQQKTNIVLREPNSTFTEAMRAVRSSLLLARGDREPRVILVTSSVAGEGKTTFTSSLAALLAIQGHSVLVVDTDLRRGTLARQLRLTREPGLSGFLSGQSPDSPIRPVPDIPGLNAVTRGAAAPNPSELLGSATMRKWLEQCKAEYDFILLDSAPVLPVSDAMFLTSLADTTILLARSRVTERQQLENSYITLKSVAKHYVGVVLNGMDPKDRGYYGYYGYYGYRENAYADKE